MQLSNIDAPCPAWGLHLKQLQLELSGGDSNSATGKEARRRERRSWRQWGQLPARLSAVYSQAREQACRLLSAQPWFLYLCSSYLQTLHHCLLTIYHGHALPQRESGNSKFAWPPCGKSHEAAHISCDSRTSQSHGCSHLRRAIQLCLKTSTFETEWSVLGQ